MTEEKWLAANLPTLMLKYLKRKKHQQGSVTDRKLRLFACACCRRAWQLYSDNRSKSAVEAIERFCERTMNASDVIAAAVEAKKAAETDTPFVIAVSAACYELEVNRRGLFNAIEWCGGCVAYGMSSTGVKNVHGRYIHNPHVEDHELTIQCEILRDIFGNPFRPVTFDPSWQTSTVLALASGIYSEKAFDRMPILADALQDAGCENEDILNHCRQPGEHVRGCWLVDLILDKK